MFLDRQFKNRVAATLGRLPGTLEALFRERFRLCGRFPIEPAKQSIKVAF